MLGLPVILLVTFWWFPTNAVYCPVGRENLSTTRPEYLSERPSGHVNLFFCATGVVVVSCSFLGLKWTEFPCGTPHPAGVFVVYPRRST